MTRRLALTPGDPAGIGPDVCIQNAQRQQQCELVVFADPNVMEQRASKLDLPLNLIPFSPDERPEKRPPGTMVIKPVALNIDIQPGIACPEASAYILKTLDEAVASCQHQQCSALVTGPVNKGIINQSGHAFTGHTEYLAAQTRSRQPVMMLATEKLRIALATTHLPLRDVPQSITPELVQSCLEVIQQDMKNYFGISNPAIMVCGINPHAGDNGALGTEERDFLEDLIKSLNDNPEASIIGPVSADTAWSAENREKTDVYLAMYHDQGLPVIKALAFNDVVNITLGLGMIRTSVDHGTAYELAGTGKASSRSLEQAIRTALEMSKKTAHERHN
jgi:4-hydroxythreonine-4-phosphate dehydrogenase